MEERTASRQATVVRFRSDDVGETTEFLRRNFGDHSRVARQPGPLGFEIEVTALAHSFAGTQSMAVASTVRAATRAVTVHLPLDCGSEYRVGRRILRSARDVAVLLVPGVDYTVNTLPGSALGMGLDVSLLESALDAGYVARPGSRRLQCVELPLSPAEAADFRRLIEDHAAAVRALAADPRPTRSNGVELRMAAWLAERIARSSGLGSLSPTSRAVAENVDAWIRAHVSQPITLEKLKVVAGVSGRTLQKACLARWGQSPLELVTSRRLEAVRAWLSAGPGAPTVTEAAVRGGFTHLGRFSVAYRKTFGETPSATLARRRSAAQESDA